MGVNMATCKTCGQSVTPTAELIERLEDALTVHPHWVGIDIPKSIARDIITRLKDPEFVERVTR